MRIVFMGTPEFAVPILRSLVDSHEVVCVYTKPDAVSGRGRARRPTPVKTEALRHGLQLHQPATLRDPSETTKLESYAPHVVVVAAYGLILTPAVLNVPLFGCVNVHASLLPRWRGAAPVQRAILAGDAVTGVSIMRMEEGLDTGPYCAVATTPVGEKYAIPLTEELASMGARLLIDALPRIASGTCEWIAQDESRATYAPKIEKEDVTLAPGLTAQEFVARVRASTPATPARLYACGRNVTVLRAGLNPASGLKEGEIRVTKGSVLFGVSDGVVEARRVKPEGKGEMDARAWACGLSPDSEPAWDRPR